MVVCVCVCVCVCDCSCSTSKWADPVCGVRRGACTMCGCVDECTAILSAIFGATEFCITSSAAGDCLHYCKVCTIGGGDALQC